MLVAAAAEPRGSWPCRRLGPGAWPPVERRAWMGPAGLPPYSHTQSLSAAPPLSGDHCPQQALTWARILRAGPSFSPMVVRRCSSVSRGRVSPSIPCSLNTWGWGAQCQGMSARAVRPGVASKLFRGSGAKRSGWRSCRKKRQMKVSCVLGMCPTLEAEALTARTDWGHWCIPHPRSL